MSGTMLRTIITAALVFHGVGHVMGVIPALRPFRVGESGPSMLKRWSSHSWLLSDALGDTAARIVCVVLFLAVLVCSVGAALGLHGWLVPHGQWRTLAVASAVISLVAIALYWNAFIAFFPHKIGALGMDVAILVCLLWANWPSEMALGF